MILGSCDTGTLTCARRAPVVLLCTAKTGCATDKSVSAGDLFYEIGYHRWVLPGLIPRVGRLPRLSNINREVAILLDGRNRNRTGVRRPSPVQDTGLYRQAFSRKLEAVASVRSWGRESSAWASVVALVQPGKWTLGALVNNVWSVAGPSDRSDGQMTVQYFVNYNLKKGWYLSFSPVITANGKASNGNVWTVPLGGGVGRVLRLGFQPVNVAAQFYGNAAHPQNGSNWSMRLQIAFLFPKFN
jgi:hypothetical protein